MKILLVNPPRSPHNAIFDYAPEHAKPFIHRRLVGPPLGLLTLAAAVRGRHDVALCDMKGIYDLDPAAAPPADLVCAWLARERPGLVGLTFIASEHPAGLAILRAVKAFDPRIVTVAGGLHCTLCPEDFDDPAVDVVVPGPATHSFGDLVDAVEAGGPLERIGGLLLRSAEGLRPSAAPRACDPAGRDFVAPDRSLLTPWLSTYVVGRATGPSTYVFTSLGCPYRCSFCSIWPQYGGAYHQRDVESVIAELKTLEEYEVVRFADANTLVDLGFARRLFERIAAEGIRKTFIMDIRADTAANNPELIAQLARGGLRVVITGFESPNHEELRRYGKNLKADLIGAAIKVFHDNGVMLRGNYIVRPDYGEAQFAGLAEYAARHTVAFAGYTILTPMPGTPFHREVAADIIDRDLAKYNFFNCVLKTKLPRERFYERVGALWPIRLGSETI
ncbi:MAG: B12-binding domain-containing radical SAM protein [Candidatus Methylomirabilia bacterium]